MLDSERLNWMKGGDIGGEITKVILEWMRPRRCEIELFVFDLWGNISGFLGNFTKTSLEFSKRRGSRIVYCWYSITVFCCMSTPLRLAFSFVADSSHMLKTWDLTQLALSSNTICLPSLSYFPRTHWSGTNLWCRTSKQSEMSQLFPLWS